MRIDPEGFAEVPNLIGKTDFQGVPAIVDILNHFGDFDLGPDERRVEHTVQSGYRFSAAGIELPDDRFRRSIEISYGRALPQKLGVVADAEVFSRALSRHLLEYRDDNLPNSAW